MWFGAAARKAARRGSRFPGRLVVPELPHVGCEQLRVGLADELIHGHREERRNAGMLPAGDPGPDHGCDRLAAFLGRGQQPPTGCQPGPRCLNGSRCVAVDRARQIPACIEQAPPNRWGWHEGGQQPCREGQSRYAFVGRPGLGVADQQLQEVVPAALDVAVEKEHRELCDDVPLLVVDVRQQGVQQ